MRRIQLIVPMTFVMGSFFTTSARAEQFDCSIQPRQMIEIRSPIEGLLSRVLVERGDSVRKGQELAFVDTSVESVLAEAAKYRSEMEGATRAGQSKLQLSARRLERAQDLFRQKFIAEQTQDEALNERQLAEAELQEARDNRMLAAIEHRRQLALIRLKTIQSPINGVVMERVLNVGELAEAGVGRKPIFRLAEVDTLYVEALLPAAAYRQVKLGMVGLVAPATPDEKVERASVTVIDRVLDAGSGTFGVRLELPNKDGRLLAGMRCKVEFAGVRVAAAKPRATDPARDNPKPRAAPAARAPLPGASK